MDFPVVLQLTTPDAVICLHDVSCHQEINDADKHATAVLFSTVTAEKYLNFIPDGTPLTAWNFPKINSFAYPNIAAFKINEQTLENVLDLFCALILRWHYMPSKVELARYTEYFRRVYGGAAYKIYCEAVKANRLNLETFNKYRVLNLIPDNARVFVQSTSSEIFSYIEDNNIKIRIVPPTPTIDLKQVDYFVCDVGNPTLAVEICSRLVNAGFDKKYIITV